jgi:hypothetical protein
MEKFQRIQAKVKRILVEEFGKLISEGEDAFIFECNDAILTLSFIRHDPTDEEGRIFLEFAAEIAFVDEVTDELKSWVAFHGAEFLIGTFVLQKVNEGAGVLFRYRILGDDIDPSEIYVASYAVAETVNIFGSEFEDGRAPVNSSDVKD